MQMNAYFLQCLQTILHSYLFVFHKYNSIKHNYVHTVIVTDVIRVHYTLWNLRQYNNIIPSLTNINFRDKYYLLFL